MDRNLPVSYQQRMDVARRRLVRALVPQSAQDHVIVESLGKWDVSALETLAMLTERAIRTRVRAGRMTLAETVVEYFVPRPGSPIDIMASMEHVASGGDDDSSIRDLVAEAYDTGWGEAVEHCRSQQHAGRDPELWDTGRAKSEKQQ